LDRIAVAPGWLAQRLLVFGAVPLFFYLLHTPVISLSALAWHHWAAGTAFNPMNTPPPQWPEGYQPSLPRIYIAWTLLLLLLYPLCVAYGRFKRRARSPLWKLL
ncbi:MAG: hypothetical protein KDI51_20875, partial [Xanthomonadales bacterium]|nr:hypothetical protein [Xanthomonadales bacterium]